MQEDDENEIIQTRKKAYGIESFYTALLMDMKNQLRFKAGLAFVSSACIDFS